MDFLRLARVSLSFLSTPSARRATEELIYKRLSEAISIHALREEGDGKEKQEVTYKRISIHALREEGDFQSLTKALYSYHDFYPRPPRGGRQSILSATC